MVRGSGLCCPVCSELIKARSDFQEQVGTSVDDTIVLSCHRLVSSILVDDISPSLFFSSRLFRNRTFRVSRASLIVD